jgi:hypothetical protein
MAGWRMAIPEGRVTQWLIHVAVNFVTLIRVFSLVVRCECAILFLRVDSFNHRRMLLVRP